MKNSGNGKARRRSPTVAGDRTGTRARVIADVCQLVATGSSIASIFRAPRDGFPSYSTFWQWVLDDDCFRRLVVQAEIDGCAALADRLVDVSRECRPGQIVTVGPKGTETKTVDMVDRSRLEADTIKWVLKCRMPKKYGDRTIVAGDAENPLAVEHTDALAALLQRPALRDGAVRTPSEDGETLQ